MSTPTVRSRWHMCCPGCQQDENIVIDVIDRVYLDPVIGATACDDGGPRWNGESNCECEACGCRGIVREFDLRSTRTVGAS